MYGEKTGAYRALVGKYERNLNERDYLEGTGVDGSIISRWIFRKWHVGARTG
jgi:hypothetical protein